MKIRSRYRRWLSTASKKFDLQANETPASARARGFFRAFFRPSRLRLRAYTATVFAAPPFGRHLRDLAFDAWRVSDASSGGYGLAFVWHDGLKEQATGAVTGLAWLVIFLGRGGHRLRPYRRFISDATNCASEIGKMNQPMAKEMAGLIGSRVMLKRSVMLEASKAQGFTRRRTMRIRRSPSHRLGLRRGR